MSTLKDDVVKLAYDNPGPVQDALLPILKQAKRGRDITVTTYPGWVDGNPLPSPKVTSVKAKNPRVTGDFTVFPDGSGAPSNLYYGGFSANLAFRIGTVHLLRMQSPPSTKRSVRTRALSVMKTAYKDLVAQYLTSDWKRLNKDLYR